MMCRCALNQKSGEGVHGDWEVREPVFLYFFTKLFRQSQLPR